MKNFLSYFVGKFVILFSKATNRGSGSTWPGHIALKINPHFLRDVVRKNKVQVVFIVGTNGKTTTAKMITTILQKNGKKVFQNTSGANLLNGIASSFISKSSLFGKVSADYAIFEVDENTLPLAIKHITPVAVIGLNLFRDQLDRYGELDAIAKKWKTALVELPESSYAILNGDDPQMAFLGESLSAHVEYFGLEEKNELHKTVQHAADSVYCPKCSHKLLFSGTYFSHLGVWHCPSCKFSRPTPAIKHVTSPLPGIYNRYNTAAAITFAKLIGISEKASEESLHDIQPAFGRQEKILFEGKQVQLFLAKNPTSFNQSIRTVVEMGGKHILFVLNDRIPDGRDVSWIWDMDIENYIKDLTTIIVSGDRAYDMALRMQYAEAEKKLVVCDELEEAVKIGVRKLQDADTLYILPTYSAMLDTRKILTGKKMI